MRLPWNERVTSYQINPESAKTEDIIRMAEELVELRKLFNDMKIMFASLVTEIEEWENRK